MHATGEWTVGFQTRLEDGRGHIVTVDLPLDEHGRDLGPSALELNVMSLAGCISTIFALVAKARHLRFDALRVTLDAERPKGAPTISAVSGEVRVTTRAPAAEVETAVEFTLRTCPVGVIFERAQIPLRIRTVVLPPLGSALTPRA